jgi:hypothetical protein
MIRKERIPTNALSGLKTFIALLHTEDIRELVEFVDRVYAARTFEDPIPNTIELMVERARADYYAGRLKNFDQLWDDINTEEVDHA